MFVLTRIYLNRVVRHPVYMGQALYLIMSYVLYRLCQDTSNALYSASFGEITKIHQLELSFRHSGWCLNHLNGNTS